MQFYVLVLFLLCYAALPSEAATAMPSRRSKFPTKKPTQTQQPTMDPTSSPTTAFPSSAPIPVIRPTESPTTALPSVAPTTSMPTRSPSLREDGIYFSLLFDSTNSSLLMVTHTPTLLPTSRRRPTTMLRTEEPSQSPEYENGYTKFPLRGTAAPTHKSSQRYRDLEGIVSLPNTQIKNNANLSSLVDWQTLYQGIHCLLDFLLLANNLAYSQVFISAEPNNVPRCNANFSECFPVQIGILITPVGQIYTENTTCIVPECGELCDDACVLAKRFDLLVTPNLDQRGLLLMGDTMPIYPENNNGSLVEIKNLVFGIQSNDLYPSGRYCRDDYLDPNAMAWILHNMTQSPTGEDNDDILDDAGLSVGLTAGIVLSAFGGALIACVGVAWCFLKRRNRLGKRNESNDEYAIDVSRLELGKQIGSGSSSRIFLAHYEGSLVCIKEMRSGVDVRLLKREVETLRILKHPHIIQLYGYGVDANRRLLVMMEVMETSLDRKLCEMHANKTEEWSVNAESHMTWAMDVIRQIALALHFVHSKEVVHCDVKPANVLFRNGVVKLCDLGIAKLVNAKTKPENIQGTISYMSPELLRNGAGISKAIDVYAFAIVVWQVFHLEPTPYPTKLTRREIQIEVLNQRRPAIHPQLDLRVARLICQSWDENPDLRPTFNEILSQLECISPSMSLASSTLPMAAAAQRRREGSSDTSFDDPSKWTSLSDVLTGVVKENKRRRRRGPVVTPLDVNSPHGHIDQSFQYDGESFVFSNGLAVHPQQHNGAYDSSKITRIALLGQGASGQVHSGVHQDTWEIVAIKEVTKFFDHQVRSQAQKEIEALGMLQHDRIVAMRAVYFNSSFASLSITLVLEFVLGDSLQRIVDYSRVGMDEPSLCVIARDVVDALLFCRERNLVHLDLKPANILVAYNGRAKLADFGLAKCFHSEGEEANTFLGTATYMSPERARGLAYSFPADVWGLGLSLATAVLGEYPLSEKRQFVFVDITDMSKEFTLPAHLSRPCREFILKCLKVDPASRAKPGELKQDKWFTSTTQAQCENQLPMLILGDFADCLVETVDSFEQLQQDKQTQLGNLAKQFELTMDQVLVVFQHAFARKQRQVQLQQV